MESHHPQHPVHDLPVLLQRRQVLHNIIIPSWKIAIYLQPTTAVQIIIITISILLILLGSGILWLHLREKKEDKKSQIDVRSVFI